MDDHHFLHENGHLVNQSPILDKLNGQKWSRLLHQPPFQMILIREPKGAAVPLQPCSGLFKDFKMCRPMGSEKFLLGVPELG